MHVSVLAFQNLVKKYFLKSKETFHSLYYQARSEIVRIPVPTFRSLGYRPIMKPVLLITETQKKVILLFQERETAISKNIYESSHSYSILRYNSYNMTVLVFGKKAATATWLLRPAGLP